MKLGIVILPDKKTSEEIGRLGSTLKNKFDLIFAVDNEKLLPHITLFHLVINNKDLGKILNKTEAVAQKTNPFLLRLKGSGGDFGYFDVEADNSKAIAGLHRKIVFETSSIRGKTYNRTDLKRGLEWEYFKKYGSRRILKLFRPHITVGRIKNEKDNTKAKNYVKKYSSSFVANRLAITEIDDQSQVYRIIKEFSMGNEIDVAAEILDRGGIVAYPTDTAYGFAVDATNITAVKKLYKLKGRSFNKPVHVIFPSTVWAQKIGRLDSTAKKLIKKLMPGPITVVVPLKAKGKSWQILSAGTKTIGLRLPKRSDVLELVKKFGKPITTTSANISFEPTPYSVAEIQKQFEKNKLKPDYYMDGGKLKKIKPSTVVLISDKSVKILREGPISEKRIYDALRNK